MLGRDGRLRVSEGGIGVGSVRVLGGSSYLAMGYAVTPPSKILKEWEVSLAAELADARVDLRVGPMPAHLMGKGTKRINRAAHSLGWEMKPTPKYVDFTKCKACGLCGDARQKRNGQRWNR